MSIFGIYVKYFHVSLWPFNNSGQIMRPSCQGIWVQEDMYMVAKKKKKKVNKSKKEEVITQRETPSPRKGKDKAFHKGKRESGREKE